VAGRRHRSPATPVHRDRPALPQRIYVSVGFGYDAKRESAKILGQCWKTSASADFVNHIFISPELDDTARVLGVLLHELIHAADDLEPATADDSPKPPPRSA
jgi:hypothetical protein